MIRLVGAVAVVFLAAMPAVWGASPESAASGAAAGDGGAYRPGFLERATRLVGLPIRDRQNVEVGRIDDLVLNLPSAQVLGALAAPAKVYGDFHVFIPAAMLVSAGGDHAILLSDRTNLLGEPWVSREMSESPDFPKAIGDAYKRFGAAALWNGTNVPSGCVKFSRIAGLNMRNRAGEDLGREVDLMVDLGGARIAFLVGSLDLAGRSFYAAPPEAVEFDPRESVLVLGADKASIARTAQSGNYIWAQMNNPNWTAATYRLHGIDVSASAAEAPADPGRQNDLMLKLDKKTMTFQVMEPPSDTELAQLIMSAVIRNGLEAPFTEDRVRITSAHGRVTLSGRAGSPEEKTRLRAIAESIAGPGKVDDQLQAGQ